jgi:hypothetical protein
VIEERKHTSKVKDPLSFEIWIAHHNFTRNSLQFNISYFKESHITLDPGWVVYGYGQIIICGGAVWGCYRMSRDRKWRQSRDVYGNMFCMSNRELRNIRPSDVFWPEVTSVTWLPEVTWPEEAMSGSGPVRKYVLRMPGLSPRFFLSSSTTCWIGVFSTTSASYDHRKPPFLFSHSGYIYIYCVVLQWWYF